MEKKKDKLFVIRKFIKASSVKDALHKEPHSAVDEVYIDDQWKANQATPLADAMGFAIKK
jgi:hypothetical protein